MDDFDRWADFTGDRGWSWESLFPYMFKVLRHLLSLLFTSTHWHFQMENLTAPTDHRDTSAEILSSIHGHHGPYAFSTLT